MTVPENNKQPTPTPPTHGVFISKGMRVGIPPGGLTIKDGQLSPVVLHASCRKCSSEKNSLILQTQSSSNEELVAFFRAESY